LKAHFKFRQVYNAQIIKRIQISNVTSRNSVQRYLCWKFNVSVYFTPGDGFQFCQV